MLMVKSWAARATVTSLLIAFLLATAAGWGTLVLGGRTDAAGRMGIALGAAVFALVAIGWRRGWLWGVAGATVIGGTLLAHFWSRSGQLP